jgi:diguanylate cyclase (GGDEF)-like protein
VVAGIDEAQDHDAVAAVPHPRGHELTAGMATHEPVPQGENPHSDSRRNSLRSRLRLALAFLVAITALNTSFLAWSGRQRAHVAQTLLRTVDRQRALSEAHARLDEQQKQVVMLQRLSLSGDAGIGEAEETRVLSAIRASQDSLRLAIGSTDDATLLAVIAGTDSLAAAWQRFYENLASRPAAARAEVDRVAAPLAERLLTTELPATIRAQDSRIQLANSAFEARDRRWYAAVWLILITSAGTLGILLWSTAGSLLRALDALKTGADRFGDSELGHRVSANDFEELAEVGQRMNTMADRLRHAHEQLAVRNEELALLAFRDPLTKLCNRALFRERVELTLGRDEYGETSVAVLFIDIDNFKAVNDTFGHNTGDQLLIDVAGRLLHATRGCDTVARLGGDEFAILLECEQRADGSAMAERVVATLGTPFHTGGRTIHIGASVGIAWGQEGENADELLRNADVAMYAAKESGKGHHRVFAPAMHKALLERAELESALRTALSNGEFALEFQPIVELATESIVGYEALTRWPHSSRGEIPPGTFIPVAESCGAILPLGRWVLMEACREASRWEQMLPAVPITVSVNVSSHQLEHADFMNDLTRVLDETSLSPQRLVLEMTESAIMRNSALNLERLRRLKDLGVRLAIDDFGTGFSSLAYLQRFPVDVIKIDKAFVKSIAISSSDAALARTILMLSDTLQLKTVAEGIEYPDQRDTLQSLGCELGQGFLFARPADGSEIRAALRSHAQSASQLGRKGGAGVHIGLRGPATAPAGRGRRAKRK